MTHKKRLLTASIAYLVQLATVFGVYYARTNEVIPLTPVNLLGLVGILLTAVVASYVDKIALFLTR